MAWADARDELITIIEGLGYTVYSVPPAQMNEALDSIIVLLVPPAFYGERQPGTHNKRTFTQRLTVMRLYGEGNEKTVGFAVHDAALVIDIELDSHVTLGGNAITVASPEWDEVSISDYPPGSGIHYVQQVGSMDITIDYATTFAA